MTLQEVIDKLVRLNIIDDEKAILFQNHITKVKIEYENDHLILTINDTQGEQNDS